MLLTTKKKSYEEENLIGCIYPRTPRNRRFRSEQRMNDNANLSELALANVEALTSGESGGGGKYYDCKQNIEVSNG